MRLSRLYQQLHYSLYMETQNQMVYSASRSLLLLLNQLIMKLEVIKICNCNTLGYCNVVCARFLGLILACLELPQEGKLFLQHWYIEDHPLLIKTDQYSNVFTDQS